MRWTSAAPLSPTAPVGETGGTRWLEGWSTFSMVWSKESAKAGTVGELSEGSHGWLDRQVHEETWIKLKTCRFMN